VNVTFLVSKWVPLKERYELWKNPHGRGRGVEIGHQQIMADAIEKRFKNGGTGKTGISDKQSKVVTRTQKGGYDAASKVNIE